MVSIILIHRNNKIRRDNARLGAYLDGNGRTKEDKKAEALTFFFAKKFIRSILHLLHMN